jgi:hypothetical protein
MLPATTAPAKPPLTEMHCRSNQEGDMGFADVESKALQRRMRRATLTTTPRISRLLDGRMGAY